MCGCCQAGGHYLSHRWPKYMSPYGVIMPQYIKRCLHFVFACTAIFHEWFGYKLCIGWKFIVLKQVPLDIWNKVYVLNISWLISYSIRIPSISNFRNDHIIRCNRFPLFSSLVRKDIKYICTMACTSDVWAWLIQITFWNLNAVYFYRILTWHPNLVVRLTRLYVRNCITLS